MARILFTRHLECAKVAKAAPAAKALTTTPLHSITSTMSLVYKAWKLVRAAVAGGRKLL